MAQNFTSAENQAAMMVNVGSQAAGTTVTLTDSKGNTLLTFTPEKAFENVVISTEALQAGSSYTLTAGSYSEVITLESNLYGTGGMGGFGGGHRNQQQNSATPLQPGAETITQ